MASDLSSGCTETIDILDEKEEGEISLEDVSSSEEGGIGHLTCGYVVKTRRPCPNCKSTRNECASWCNISSKIFKDDRSKSRSRNRREVKLISQDPVKGKENRHHVNEVGSTTTKHALSTLQEKNDDLVPISSDSDMEIVGLANASKQLVTRSNARIKKKKKKKKDYEYVTVDDLISPSSIDLSITEYSSDSREVAAKRINLSRPRYRESSSFRKSSRSRVISKSPLRKYRSPVRVRSPFGSPPPSRSKSPPLRRSPRRLRSPKRSSSSHRSPARTTSRLLKSDPAPSSRTSHNHIDRYGDMTRLLLKKVKHLHSVGAHTPESGINRGKGYQSSSLKEKLSNMMKKVPDDNITHLKEKPSVQNVSVNDADDEEDLALLRQKALETKQKKSSKSEHPAETEAEKKAALVARTNDDEDEEDLELRMIALRSAVMKKHQNRVQRGVRAKNKKVTISNHSESPFTQSFLDNIPIPGDELLKFASPPCTPPLILLADSNHIEDMELDTDVEREKEKLPYSPTDKITSNVPIDTELLGIDPSDVSFINLNNTDNSLISIAAKDERKSIPIGTAPPCHACLKPHNYGPSPKRFAYSPSPRSGDESFHEDLNDDQGDLSSYLKNLHGDSIECDLIDGICCQGDMYSSTITPMYEEADVTSQTLPITTDLPASSLPSKYVQVSSQAQNATEQFSGDLLTHVNSTSKEQSSNVQGNKRIYEIVSKYPVTDSPAVSALGSTSSNGSMVTIDDLPEADGDPGSPAVINRPVSPTAEHIPSEELPCQTDGTAQEPLYIQGVPDVTKDVNKIPTLINRTLVPAPILKSNKQLQQPLPLPKKHEAQLEPTFKSAEMQPVVITTDTSARNSTNFKPIKLVSFAKKSQPVLTMPVVFDDSVSDSLQNTSNSESHETTESKNSVSNTATVNNDVVPVLKKRKRTKRNRPNINIAIGLENRKNNSCTYDVNKDVNKDVNTTIFIPQEQTVESDKKKSNDDNEIQKNFTENKELSNLQTESLVSINSNDIKIDNVKIDEQRVSSNDKEGPKHIMISTSNECQQVINIDSSVNCLSTNLDTAANKSIEVTKDTDDRRQSIDEDEDELRAILLASLAKRMTKSSDTSGTSAVSVTIIDETSADITPMTVSTNAPLPSIISPEVNESINILPRANENINDITKETVSKLISSPAGSRKRCSNMTMAKGPLKKIIKKAPISASTKVVNNAKKYQNTIVQRKLNNLQKHDTNMQINKKKSKQDSVWSSNLPTKTSMKIHASETQRIVINLGSDTDSESESERCNTITSSSNTLTANAQDSVDFEKSLHKFLRDVRKEQETAAASKITLSPQTTRRDTPSVIQTDQNKDTSNMHTPLAVRHLPASQQEEYRRLKQQILEREKLKLQRKIINKSNNSNNTNNKLLNNASVSLSKSLLPYDKESLMSVKQDQIKLRELERNFQQSPTEVKTKNVDVVKSTPTLNASRMSGNSIVSTNIAKQTNSIHLPAKGAKKTMPNLSIRITNEIAPTYTTAESRIVEDSIEQQSMSDKQSRPILRTLSRDEINRKYVQIQLNQDTTERVVTINDKISLEHNVASTDQNEKPVENDNITAENSDERTINRNIDDNTDNQFSNASTITLNLFTNSNTSKQESEIETTMSRSQYEREREINCNLILSSENNNRNDNNGVYNKVNASNDKGTTDDIWSALKKNVKEELDSLTCLPEPEQRRYLSDTEHKLVTRRYTVLDYLAEMSGNLRQLDMEKDLCSSLNDEVKKLKEQLRIAEEKLQVQRNRVNIMCPKISTARQKINTERRECFKLSRICSALGKRLTGKDYKLPEAADQLLNSKLKEVANHTRQLSKKKLLSNDVPENSIFCTSPPQTSFSSELSNITHTQEDLSLQNFGRLLPDNMTIANSVEGSKSNTFHLKQSNDVENLNTSQILSNQVTPKKKDQVPTIVSNDQSTPNEDILFSEPNLTSTPIPVEQDSQCMQRNRKTDYQELSMADFSLLQDNKQRNDERTEMMAVTMITTAPMTTTTTTATTTTTTTGTATTTTITITATTTTTITPYVSILTHLKTPRNANPNGILCPYDLMGVCNDGGCQFVHQSTSHT